MATHYRGGDRTQSFLLPPDVRDWLPEDHLAWLVIELVAAADTSPFHARSRRGGRGRAGFDPDVLLTLLIYAYAIGERSSRRIERACHTDVACRVITGNEVPDHTVIARFRQAHQERFAALFVELLAVCAGEGMVEVGTIALDGTKIAADASRLANRTREQLRDEVDRIVAEADTVDAAEDARFGGRRGDELPQRLAPGADRLARLQACLEDLEQAHPEQVVSERVEEARQRVDELRGELTAMEAARADYLADREAGRRGPGRRRPPGAAGPPQMDKIAKKQRAVDAAQRWLEELQRRPDRTTRDQPPRRNPTDPDSRLMRSQGGWVQGYNAQAAVSADGLIVACDVTNQVADTTMFVPMLERITGTLIEAEVADPVRAVLADAGYYSSDNVTAEGPPRLIPPRSTMRASHAQAMRRRLEQPAMASLYRRRFRVEQAFGRIKHNHELRRFARRGLDAARGEWHLICLAHNLNALHRHRGQRAVGRPAVPPAATRRHTHRCGRRL